MGARMAQARIRAQKFSLAAACVGLASAALAGPAGATNATATLSAGSFGFVSAPPAISISDTLNGLNQNATTSQALDVGDATGSGAGWDITATSTTFTAGSHSLSTAATTIPSAPTVACDTNSTCTTATDAVTYPYALPAASTAPTATKIYNAAANTGMGDQTISPTWQVAVPANSFAGTYTSTWTLSLVSGP